MVDYPQVLLQNRMPDKTAGMDEYREKDGYTAVINYIGDACEKSIVDLISEAYHRMVDEKSPPRLPGLR